MRRAPTFTSSELSVTLHRKSSSSGSLHRASTGNVMLSGHLGNLKQRGNNKSVGDVKGSKTMQKGNSSGKYGTMGNILKKPTEKNQSSRNVLNGVSSKLDPEELKSIGNEQFRQGNLEKALVLYDQAIALDSSKASFYSNKVQL